MHIFHEAFIEQFFLIVGSSIRPLQLVAGALGKLVLPSSGLRSRLLHVSRLLCVLFLGTVSCKLRLATTNPVAIQFSKLAEPMR